MLTQAPPDVLRVDDRVADHHHDGEDESRHDHRVDRRPSQMEHDHCQGQRQQRGHRCDQGGAPLEQERQEQQDQEREADEQRLGDVVGGLRDVVGRPEE